MAAGRELRLRTSRFTNA